jgi:hypothetical protein
VLAAVPVAALPAGLAPGPWIDRFGRAIGRDRMPSLIPGVPCSGCRRSGAAA